MKRPAFRTTLILLFTVIIPPLSAQQSAELFSPWFFGLGPLSTSLDAPVGPVFNPASAALEQRTRLEASYLALPDLVNSTGWGHAANLGVSLPTNFGVFSFAGHFQSVPFPQSNIGTLGGLHIALSKDLYDNFFIGIGVNSFVSDRAGLTDWSLGGDVGVIHRLGQLGFLRDVTWALAVRSMGKGIQSSGVSDPLPQPFTPALGISLKPIKTDAFSWMLYADFSFPRFSNFLLYVGTELDLFHTVRVRGSFHLDTAALSAGDNRFPVSFGLSLVLHLDLQKSSDALGGSISGSDLRVDAAYAPLADGVHVMGLGLNLALGSVDVNPPVVTLEPLRPEGADPENPVYISPNLDGVQDDLELKTSITDQRFIKGYRLIIEDKAGRSIRVIENKEERPENIDALNVLNRLIYVKSGVAVPDTLRWDGKTQDGGNAPDGDYTYHVEAWDDNGNKTVTTPAPLVVDMTAPTITAGAAYPVFSPNGDGNKDTLPLSLTGSREDIWRAAITDATGREVRRFEWKDAAPTSVAWDGKDDAGTLVDDGVYTFTISSRDRAGNSTVKQVDNIIINTMATPITMTVNTGYFSPNGDGVKDTVVFSLTVPVMKGIDSWSLAVLDTSKRPVRTFAGKESIDLSITFDGRSDDKTMLPEGTYRASLDVKYVNGNNPRLNSPDIVLDLTPPRLNLSVDNPVFSPNNDGNKDYAVINLETSREEAWEADIRDRSNGKVVRTWRWKGQPDARLSWGGRGDSGTLLTDGVYTFQITSTDRAGNTTRSDLKTLTINTEETPVLITASLTSFSPNGDRIKDSINLLPQLKVTSGIDSWILTIKDAAGRIVRTQRGGKSAPRALEWDGTTDARTQAPDGVYSGEIQVLYVNGNNPVAKTAPFSIDTRAPTITVSAAYTLFSPDGDGLKDTLPVTQTSSEEELWEAAFTDQKGRIVRNLFWKGHTENLAWDGKDDNGNVLPDGEYAYSIACTDPAGNMTRKELKDLVIDVTPTPVFLTLDQPAFSPNGDRVMDDVTFSIYAENRRNLTGWTLTVDHEKLGAQKTFQGGADLPEKLTWDGSTDAKTRAPEGTYTATLTVEYAKGNRPSEKSKPYVLDVSAPAADFRLAPLPFSPDNDGVEDELVMTQKVTDATGVSRWKIEITDPEKNHFISYEGTGTPAERIIWNGLSDRGELVQAATDYKLVFTLTDAVGNTASIDRIIPVDVLVIRDGDRLYVRVPSITFKPNTADYKDVAKEALDKNLWTLKRLGQIFNKYRSYNILIEGHAVSVYWRDPARAQREQTEELIPLSKKRAEAVRQALINEGIEPVRISTEGVGAKRPLFPFSDEKNLWKNRRVEFILLKK